MKAAIRRSRREDVEVQEWGVPDLHVLVQRIEMTVGYLLEEELGFQRAARKRRRR